MVKSGYWFNIIDILHIHFFEHTKVIHLLASYQLSIASYQLSIDNLCLFQINSKLYIQLLKIQQSIYTTFYTYIFRTSICNLLFASSNEISITRSSIRIFKWIFQIESLTRTSIQSFIQLHKSTNLSSNESFNYATSKSEIKY